MIFGYQFDWWEENKIYVPSLTIYLTVENAVYFKYSLHLHLEFTQLQTQLNNWNVI